jgi:hypothetical protein
MPSDRRARKRAKKNEALEAFDMDYIRTRISCDRCGLEQPFRSHAWEGKGDVSPCAGPLGLDCDSETAVFLDYWMEVNMPTVSS